MNNQYNNYPYYQQNQMDRINQQIQQLQQLQMQYNQYAPQQNSQNIALSNRGTYVYVNDYQEVVNYPTPADGNAILFFNLDKGILWSKKFINGSNSIQAFTISPLNSFSNEPINNSIQDKKPLVEENNNDLMDNLLNRMTNIEDKFDKIMSSLNQNNRQQMKNNNNGNIKEVVKDV